MDCGVHVERRRIRWLRVAFLGPDCVLWWNHTPGTMASLRGALELQFQLELLQLPFHDPLPERLLEVLDLSVAAIAEVSSVRELLQKQIYETLRLVDEVLGHSWRVTPSLGHPARMTSVSKLPFSGVTLLALAASHTKRFVPNHRIRFLRRWQ